MERPLEEPEIEAPRLEDGIPPSLEKLQISKDEMIKTSESKENSQQGDLFTQKVNGQE